MATQQLIANSIEDLDDVSKVLIDLMQEHPVVLLKGDLGAGKTTLTKNMCKLLNVRDEVTSPTFSLLNQYVTEQGKYIYHFDLYRLKDLEEALDIGVDEYLNSGNICLIEWPDVVEELIPENTMEVNIQLEGSKRLFNISI